VNAAAPAPPAPLPVSRGLAAALALFRFGAASFELFLGCLWLAGRVEPLQLLGAHLALAGALLAVAWALRRFDSGLWIDAALLSLTGPLGAVSILWQRGAPERNPAVSTAVRSAEALPGPSLADALDAEILAGRRRRGDPENRLSMMDRLARGDLGDQQFAIAILSLKYQPEMHPVLLSALQSPTPAVRVQAAAVFAKLRERFSAEAKRLLSAQTPDDPGARRDHAAACRALVRSPFADGEVATALARCADALDAFATGGEPVSAAAPAKASRRVPGEAGWRALAAKAAG